MTTFFTFVVAVLIVIALFGAAFSLGMTLERIFDALQV